MRTSRRAGSSRPSSPPTCFEVASGNADEEYQDPKAFFARTYLTEGLRDLLVGAARRLSGDGGDPVIELQTNFGGGKTHSMIALYHLASGVAAKRACRASARRFAEAGVSLPPQINRAVLGRPDDLTRRRRSRSRRASQLHTLWGHLAYQLGGREGYELVRDRRRGRHEPGRRAQDALPAVRAGRRADRRVGGLRPSAPRRRRAAIASPAATSTLSSRSPRRSPRPPPRSPNVVVLVSIPAIGHRGGRRSRARPRSRS